MFHSHPEPAGPAGTGSVDWDSVGIFQPGPPVAARLPNIQGAGKVTPSLAG
jgi:hypothetical protein